MILHSSYYLFMSLESPRAVAVVRSHRASGQSLDLERISTLGFLKYLEVPKKCAFGSEGTFWGTCEYPKNSSVEQNVHRVPSIVDKCFRFLQT